MSTPKPTEARHELLLQSGLPHPESQPLIQTEQLSLHYGEKLVFADVTLPIQAGCITALVGPSGCGKTSFLSCLNRLTDLIPRCAVSGHIRIGATPIFDPAVDVISLRRR